MKKFFFSMLLVAAVAMAGTVTFGPAVDNMDGTCTIPYTADAAVVGFALDVDATGDVSAVQLDSFFDVFMDYANAQGESYVYGEGTPIATQDAAGTATLPLASFCISAGGLEDDETDVPAMTGSIVLTAAASLTGTLDANALRGGVVDYDGAMETNLPITFAITVGGPVMVDVPNVVGMTETAAGDALVAAGLVKGAVTTTTDGATAMNDGQVASQDPAAATSVEEGSSVDLVLYSYVAPPSQCTIHDLDGNGFVTLEDLNAAVSYMNTLSGSGYFAFVDTTNSKYDLDSNGFITLEDLNSMVSYMNGLAGSGYFEFCN